MDQDELVEEIAQAAEYEWFSLGLSEEQIEYLPTEIGNLTGLRYLHITGNALTQLPPEIGT